MTKQQLLKCTGKRYLYYKGNEFADITGGWQGRAWSGNTAIWNAVAPTITKESTAIKMDLPDTMQSGKSGVLEHINTYDLTNVSTLRFRFSASFGAISSPQAGRYQRVYVFVSDVTSGNWTTTPTVADLLALMMEHTSGSQLDIPETDVTLDVTTMNGLYRVYVGLVWVYQAAASWVRLHELELVA